MDLKKAKKLLSKINTLFQNIQSDEGNLSAIEKDLMLSYLRDLYDNFQSESDETPSEAKVSTPEPEPEEDVEVIRVEKPSAPPPPKPRPKPRIVEIPEKVKKNLELEVEPSNPAPPAEPEPEPSVTPEPAPVVEEKPVAPPKSTPKPVSKGSFSEEIEALFERPKAKELSDKLGELPIKDLTKSMGLNEKIFTINELFGGNQESFDGVIQHLNGLSQFDDAKVYLMGVADEFDWASKSKSKKARNFIKLVRRRYQ